MLPALTQGAIMVVCREEDKNAIEACKLFNYITTAACTKIERDFLRSLVGGCYIPIRALADIKKNRVNLSGNMFSPYIKQKKIIK